MATIRKLIYKVIDSHSSHTEVDCTYSIVETQEGIFLQIDTYGSKQRQDQGKKSQSLRFSPEAIKQLREIIEAALKTV